MLNKGQTVEECDATEVSEQHPDSYRDSGVQNKNGLTYCKPKMFLSRT